MIGNKAIVRIEEFIRFENDQMEYETAEKLKDGDFNEAFIKESIVVSYLYKELLKALTETKKNLVDL